MHIIDYQGESPVAVDLVLNGLCNDTWGPGDWFVEAHVAAPGAESDDDVTVIAGYLTGFEREERGCTATIEPHDGESRTGDPVKIDTYNIVKLVVP